VVTFRQESSKECELSTFAVPVKAAKELLDIVTGKFMAEEKQFGGVFGFKGLRR
jgi:hypothetical protein